MLDLEDVLINDQLARRTSRDEDAAAELKALDSLLQAMGSDPSTVLRRCTSLAIELCRAESAGVSVFEPGEGAGRFRWVAIAGAYAGNVGFTLPRDASPCGVVLDRDETLLLRSPARFFPALESAQPAIHEALLTPWRVDGRAEGTLWVIQHSAGDQFDAEDARLLTRLARVAAAAWRMALMLDDARTAGLSLERQVHESERALRASQRIQTALRESEERFRLIAENVLAGQFVWDLASDLVTMPRTMLATFELDDGPMPAERILGKIHPDDLPGVRAGLEPGFDPLGDGVVRACYRVPQSDGSMRWLESMGRVEFESCGDGTRSPVRAFGVIWDVTEHQRLLQELRDVDRRKDEFLAMLAHELRNPLAPLRNALHLLDREPLGASGLQALDMGRRQIRHLTRLVDDLLEVSRVTRGLIELKPEPVMVQHVVHGVVDGLEPALRERGQNLVLEMPEQAVRLVADPVRLAQIVDNLLTNAIKYTDPGGRIVVRVDVSEDAVTVVVQDSGIGIAAEDLPHIFALFTQADTAIDRSRGGLGIGLALVRRLVELHGGSVQARSDGPGNGSTFEVRLPRPADGAAER